MQPFFFPDVTRKNYVTHGYDKQKIIIQVLVLMFRNTERQQGANKMYLRKRTSQKDIRTTLMQIAFIGA